MDKLFKFIKNLIPQEIKGFLLGNFTSLVSLIHSFRIIKKNEIKNILLIKLDRIGDFVLTVPALRALRSSFRESKITILAAPWLRNFVENCPYIDNYILYDYFFPDGNCKILNSKNKKEIKKLLLPYKFELSIDFRPDGRTSIFTFLSGAKYRLGYRTRERGYYLTHSLPASLGKKHLIEYYSDILKLLGIKVKNLDLELWISQEDKDYIENFLNENNVKQDDLLIGIHSFSNNPLRLWKKEGLAQVGDYFAEKYKAKIIFTGSQKNIETIKEIVKLMRIKPIIAAGKTNLCQLAALIAKFELFFSLETGPLHISMAVGTPTVDIHSGTTPASKHGPFGKTPYAIVKKDIDCSPCWGKIECKKRYCMDDITSKEVISAGENLLSIITIPETQDK